MSTDSDDRALARQFGVSRLVWIPLGAALAALGTFEFSQLDAAAGDADILRMQAINGALVLLGAIAGFALTTLVVMLPLRRMTTRMLAAQIRFEERADKTFDRVDGALGVVTALAQDVRGRLGVAERIEGHLAELVVALKPIKVKRDAAARIPDGPAPGGAPVPVSPEDRS